MARLGSVGDRLIVMAFAELEPEELEMPPAARCGPRPRNQIVERIDYPPVSRAWRPGGLRLNRTERSRIALPASRRWLAPVEEDSSRMRQVLFTIPVFGGLRVFGYGAMLVLAFIGSTWLAAWRARREKLDPDVILDMAFWVFLFGMVGARLFYCIEYWGTDQEVWDVVQYWKGGIVYYGGILGGSLAFFVYRHFRPFPLRPYLDAWPRDWSARSSAGLAAF